MLGGYPALGGLHRHVAAQQSSNMSGAAQLDGQAVRAQLVGWTWGPCKQAGTGADAPAQFVMQAVHCRQRKHALALLMPNVTKMEQKIVPSSGYHESNMFSLSLPGLSLGGCCRMNSSIF